MDHPPSLDSPVSLLHPPQPQHKTLFRMLTIDSIAGHKCLSPWIEVVNVEAFAKSDCNLNGTSA